MNFVSRSVTFAFVASFWMIPTATADGQTLPSGASTSPYQQTLSPYLDLLRSDASTLSPYHSFVRPRQQVRQQLQHQSSQIQRVQRETQFPQSQSSPSRLQTGRGGSFNKFLHFYPNGAGRQRR